MKNKYKLFALAALIGFSFAACDLDGNDGGESSHWLISSQTTYRIENGVASDAPSASTSYNWIAYQYTDRTNFEEEYTTKSSTYTVYSYPNDTYSYYFYDSYSDYHYTRTGQTSYSTTETISRTETGSDIYLLVYSVPEGTTSTTSSSYDLESGFTSSSTTISSSSGTSATLYAIELLSDTGEVKTYKYQVLGSNPYSIYEIKDGRTQKVSYYDENQNPALLYTTTYTESDNAEIRARLPNFTLYTTTYYATSYSIRSSYQTVEVLPTDNNNNYYDRDSRFIIRVKTFNDGTLSSQTDYGYSKINFGGNSTPNIGGGYFPDGAEIKREGDYYYIDEDGEITIRYTGTGGNVNIPAQIKGKPVTTIAPGAFANCYRLTSVSIPDSVTTIASGAFANCYRLTSVTIPNSVTVIGGGAFYNCYRLPSVSIPNSLTTIENGVFAGCWNLTSITIPNSVTSIKGDAFCECVSLASVTFQGTIDPDDFDTYAFSSSFMTNRYYGLQLSYWYLAEGPGTYTITDDSGWIKQQ
jgi:hypothetical protein